MSQELNAAQRDNLYLKQQLHQQKVEAERKEADLQKSLQDTLQEDRRRREVEMQNALQAALLEEKKKREAEVQRMQAEYQKSLATLSNRQARPPLMP